MITKQGQCSKVISCSRNWWLLTPWTNSTILARAPTISVRSNRNLEMFICASTTSCCHSFDMLPIGKTHSRMAWINMAKNSQLLILMDLSQEFSILISKYHKMTHLKLLMPSQMKTYSLMTSKGKAAVSEMLSRLTLRFRYRWPKFKNLKMRQKKWALVWRSKHHPTVEVHQVRKDRS